MVKHIPAVPSNLHEIAILLDVDGTILDIAPTPDRVRASASLCRTLARLAERTGGATALVSGRSLADLDRIFAPLRLPAIGGHGAEIRPSADDVPHRAAARDLDSGLRRRLADVAAAGAGVLMEDKGYSMALHYRLAPEQAGTVKKAVEAIRSAYPDGSIEVLPGKSVIEVKRAGFDKGTALRELMAHPAFAGRRPIFIGDDTTDEAAFAVLPEFRGLPISVGRAVVGVDNHLDSPRDVRRWLERIANGDGIADGDGMEHP
jgi:trehalose 6-phosphate phosphatase